MVLDILMQCSPGVACDRTMIKLNVSLVICSVRPGRLLDAAINFNIGNLQVFLRDGAFINAVFSGMAFYFSMQQKVFRWMLK